MSIEIIILIIALCFIFREVIMLAAIFIGGLFFMLLTVIFIWFVEIYDKIRG